MEAKSNLQKARGWDWTGVSVLQCTAGLILELAGQNRTGLGIDEHKLGKLCCLQVENTIGRKRVVRFSYGKCKCKCNPRKTASNIG